MSELLNAAEIRDEPLPAGSVDDRALMARVAQGDGDAFRTLTGRHMPMVHALAWRMLADGAEAEDVVQEVFTKLWVGAKSWTPVGGGLGAWLRRIATNACLDRLRRRRHLSAEPVPERADEAPGADIVLDEERRRRAVTVAIQALPDRQRAAIVLTYYEGASNAEAASTLGLGVKALESLLVRARQSLSRSLAAQGLISQGADA